MTTNTTEYGSVKFVPSGRNVQMYNRTWSKCCTECGGAVRFRIDMDFNTVSIEDGVYWSRIAGNSENGYEVTHKHCLGD